MLSDNLEMLVTPFKIITSLLHPHIVNQFSQLGSANLPRFGVLNINIVTGESHSNSETNTDPKFCFTYCGGG